MKTVKLTISPVDRSAMSDMLPKTGNIVEVKKYNKWLESLRFDAEENEFMKSFDQIRNKDDRDKAINDWYHTKKEMELDSELVDYIKKEISARDSSKVIGLGEDTEFYEYILSL